MSLRNYEQGKQLSRYCAENDIEFYAVLQCAMRMADSYNVERLETAFPSTWKDLQDRYNAPGGMLPTEDAALEESKALTDAMKKALEIPDE